MTQPMDLDQIRTDLASAELQIRLQALSALRAHEISSAVPLLCSQAQDPNPLVRVAVASGLGLKRSPQSKQAIQALLQDEVPMVRAEAVTALSRFSPSRLTQNKLSQYRRHRPADTVMNILLQTFEQDPSTLVRSAVLETVATLKAPLKLFKLCTLSLDEDDITLQEQATLMFGQFAETDMQISALDHLQPLARSPHGSVRAALARSLQRFDNHRARETLMELQGDRDHRVVAAVLERLM